MTERDGSQRPVGMICNAKLRNSSLIPAKLKKYLVKLQGDWEYRNTTLAEFKVKRARFDEKATLPSFGLVPNQSFTTPAVHHWGNTHKTSCVNDGESDTRNNGRR